MSKFGWAIGKDLNIDSDMANKLDKAADILDAIFARREAQIEQWGDETGKAQAELTTICLENLGKCAQYINMISAEMLKEAPNGNFVSSNVNRLRSTLVELAAATVLQIEALDKLL